MIIVTMALVPYGIGTPSRLGWVEISNQANHPEHPRKGNYKVVFKTKTGKTQRTVFVNDYPRKSKHPFELLYRAMEEYKKAEKEEKEEKRMRKLGKDASSELLVRPGTRAID